MSFVVVALISLVVLCIIFSMLAAHVSGDLADLVCTLLSFVSGLIAVVLAIYVSSTAFLWQASFHRAAIVNREYGTNYTREEIFYASNVIDTIRELDRKRVEINGNIMGDGK